MTESINQSITRLFVEQPLASPGSAKNYIVVELVGGGSVINGAYPV